MPCSEGCTNCGRCSGRGYSLKSPAQSSVGNAGNYSRFASYSPSSASSYSEPAKPYSAESRGDYQ